MSHGVTEYKVRNTISFRTLQRHVKSAGLCSVSGASGGGLAGWGGGGRGEKPKEDPGACGNKKGQAWDLAKRVINAVIHLFKKHFP